MCIEESNEIRVVFQFYQNTNTLKKKKKKIKIKFNKRSSTTKFAVKAFPLVCWKRAKDD